MSSTSFRLPPIGKHPLANVANNRKNTNTCDGVTELQARQAGKRCHTFLIVIQTHNGKSTHLPHPMTKLSDLSPTEIYALASKVLLP